MSTETKRRGWYDSEIRQGVEKCDHIWYDSESTTCPRCALLARVAELEAALDYYSYATTDDGDDDGRVARLALGKENAAR